MHTVLNQKQLYCLVEIELFSTPEQFSVLLPKPLVNRILVKEVQIGRPLAELIINGSMFS